MHIAVVLRLVPDLAEEIEIAESDTDIDREWVGLRLNEFDDQALEAAIVLKERQGARVTALALDGDGIDRMLQGAIARGADQALKIVHRIEGAPASRTAAPLIAAAVSRLRADLVVTGVQTPEDLFGQLAPFLGATLGWPHVSAVSGILLDGGAIEVGQEQGGGFSATLRLELPAVLGIQASSQPPRYVSGTKLRQAMSEKIETVEVDAEPAPKLTALTRLAVPERSGGAAMLEGDADAVANENPPAPGRARSGQGMRNHGRYPGLHRNPRWQGPADRARTSLGRAVLASATGGRVEAALFGAAPNALAAQLGAADRVLVVAHPALKFYTPEAHGAALLDLVRRRNPQLVLLGYTSIGLDLAPALALCANLPLVGYCRTCAIVGGKLEADSLIYGGKLAAASRSPLPAVIAITPGSFPEADALPAAETAIEVLEPPAFEVQRMKFVREFAPDPNAVDITAADKIVCIGRGIGDRDSVALAEQVAALLGAEVAGSRPIIDNGWLPKGTAGRKIWAEGGAQALFGGWRIGRAGTSRRHARGRVDRRDQYRR